MANATGTGTSTGELITAAFSGASTQPVILISTSFATGNAVRLEFEYLPEDTSFGVTAEFKDDPVPFTSARRLTYDHSEIEEVSLSVKVVAGCNNAVTYFSGNLRGSTGAPFDPQFPLYFNKLYSNPGGFVATKHQRVALITIAQLLYSLPLPSSNLGSGEGGTPPPTCRFVVGRMFSGIGAFTGCSIKFNGPYDYDGSPTDMDVSLRFKPSEFYDSSQGMGVSTASKLQPTATPTGNSLVTSNTLYALTFGDTPEAQAQPTAAITYTESGGPTAPPVPLGGPTAPPVIHSSQVQGATGPTPTNPEVAAYGPKPGVSPLQVSYDQKKDVYTIAGTQYQGKVVRDTVTNNKSKISGGPGLPPG